MRSSPRLILAACLTAFAFSGLSCQKNRRRFEHRYLEKLASSDETVLKRAILGLGRARSIASIPPLLEFAERGDEVGDLAAVALSMIGLESVSFYMSYGGEAGTPADVNDALRALAERASAARPRLLEIALKDPDDRFRAIAGDVLTSLGARPGMPGIIDALESGDHAVRLRSLRLIGRIGPPARSALAAVLAATAEDPDLPYPAASALVSVVSKNPAVLVSQLHGENPNARFTVALTFERLGYLSEPHVTELAKRLFDEDIRVARAVARTLARLGARAKEAAPQIVRAIREARYEHPGSVINGFVWDPRVPLTTALGAMGPVTPEVIPALLEAVRATDSSDLQLRMAQDFRSGAVRALGDLEAWDPEILPVLADSLKDPVLKVRHAAVLALGKVDRAEVVPILRAVIDTASDEPGSRSSGFASLPLVAAQALVGLDGTVSGLVPCFTDLLEDRRASIRRIAVRALSGFGRHARPAVPGIVGLLKDRQSEVRKEAARTLEKLGRHAPSAIPHLTRVVKRDPSRSVQRAAGRALERIRAEGQKLNAENAEAQRAAEK